MHSQFLNKFGYMDNDLAIKSSRFGIKVSSGPGNPDVILEVQLSGLNILYDLLKLARNYIFALFKTRTELLKVHSTN